MQRRLHERDTSYLRIVDAARRDLALEYLRNASLSIGEISFLLRFSDIAAFTHAFKRWTGAAPTRYRERLWTRSATRTSSPRDRR